MRLTSRGLVVLWVLFAIAVALIIGPEPASGAPRDGRRTRATYYSGSFGGCGVALTGNYAASKFYACGQKVRVTRKGKSVTVVIKDRCQCMMDLSKHSFAKLAPLSLGVINVRLWKVR